jgi:hypothetical protein
MRQGISIAANRDKKALLTAIADLLGANDPDIGFNFHYYSDDDVLRWVVYRDFRCFCPASAFSIPELERRLAQRPEGIGQSSIDLRVFGGTPIVLMMSSDVYRSLEEGGPVGWQTLLSLTARVGLMHAHGESADGLAVMTAVSEAAARRFGSVSVEDEYSGRDEFVRAVEGQVLEYAPR